jgi:hypothetical protein
MGPQADLLAEIEALLPHLGIKETTFGVRAVNDGKFVPRLRNGANMTLSTMTKVRMYLQAERDRLAADAPEVS